MLQKKNKIVVLSVLLMVLTASPCARSKKPGNSDDTHQKFDRSQTLLINLKSAPMSAGYYILHSFGVSRAMGRDLDRALNQVLEADKAYAKSKHKPDDRYLQNACLKITLAKQTAGELEAQLHDAYSELKSSIEETLVTDTNFK
jgi:hypothetical protein